MNKYFFLNKFRVLIESSYSAVACRSKKTVFTEIVTTRIVLQNSKKKTRYRDIFKNWSIITFPCMMTTSYLSLVYDQASNHKNMVICALQRNAITFSSFCRLWVAIATVTLVIVIALRKTKTKNAPMGCEMKKIKKHSKKMKMRHRRYNYHFWGLNDLPM